MQFNGLFIRRKELRIFGQTTNLDLSTAVLTLGQAKG